MCFFYFDRLKKRCIIISVGGIRLLSYAYKFYFYTFPPLYAKGAVARQLLLLLLLTIFKNSIAEFLMYKDIF